MNGSIFDKGNLFEKYEADLCTHINVMPIYADASSSSLRVWTEDVYDVFKDIQKFRKINPEIKILATILDMGAKSLAIIAQNKTMRKKFAQNSLLFLETHNFDGIDFDWEFPAWTSKIEKEKEDFISLLKEMHRVLKSNPSKEYLLTSAVAGDYTIINPAYQVKAMDKYLDWINLMTYAFNNWFWYWPFTGHNAPLFSSKTDIMYLKRINMAYACKYWHSKGMPKEKIIVGIPTYTHNFKLVNPRLHGVHAPAWGPAGEWNVAEVCNFLNQSGSHRAWDGKAHVPYAYNTSIWITFEDQESAVEKAEWIRDNGFGGSMTYNLNNDDYQGVCKEGKPFILHKVLRDILM